MDPACPVSREPKKFSTGVCLHTSVENLFWVLKGAERRARQCEELAGVTLYKRPFATPPHSYISNSMCHYVLDEYRDNRNSKAITVAINQIYAHAFSRVRRLFEYLNQAYALSHTQTVKLSKLT